MYFSSLLGVYARFCLAIQIWEKSNYETLKKVRYLSKAGTYEFRC